MGTMLKLVQKVLGRINVACQGYAMAVYASTLKAGDIQALQDADVHANLEAKETREQSTPVECPRHAVWAAVNSILLPAAHTGCRKPV